MKKIFVFILGLILLMCGCSSGSDSGDTSSTQSQQATEEMQTEEDTNETKEEDSAKTELPLGSDIGDVTMYISTPGGTSEDGNIPIILIEEDTLIKQISMRAKEYDSSSFSYVYIDSVFFEKEQFGDSQHTISLEGNFLDEGEHTISVVQYEGNEEGAEILTYKEAKYTIEFE